MKRSEPKAFSFLFIFIAVIALWIFPFWYISRPDEKDTENILTIRAVWPAGTDIYYPGQSPIVSENKSFSNPLTLKDYTFPDGHSVSYHYKYEKLPRRLYVTRPTVCVRLLPDKTNPVTVQMDSPERAAVYKGQEMFRIASIEAEKFAAGVFHITVTFDPTGNSLPIGAALTAGNLTMDHVPADGDPGYSYDEQTGFTTGRLKFIYNVGAEEDISGYLDHAVLHVEEMLLHTDEIECTISSDPDSIELLIHGSDLL